MALCYDMQLATPRAPARAVSTAMRILRICFQSVFIVSYELWVMGTEFSESKPSVLSTEGGLPTPL